MMINIGSCTNDSNIDMLSSHNASGSELSQNNKSTTMSITCTIIKSHNRDFILSTNSKNNLGIQIKHSSLN